MEEKIKFKNYWLWSKKNGNCTPLTASAVPNPLTVDTKREYFSTRIGYNCFLCMCFPPTYETFLFLI